MRITENELPYEKECIYPFAMTARYADDSEFFIYGQSEDDCICEIARLTEIHGECTWFSGITNEDREWGEWIGRENFIYD